MRQRAACVDGRRCGQATQRDANLCSISTITSGCRSDPRAHGGRMARCVRGDRRRGRGQRLRETAGVGVRDDGLRGRRGFRDVPGLSRAQRQGGEYRERRRRKRVDRNAKTQFGGQRGNGFARPHRRPDRRAGTDGDRLEFLRNADGADGILELTRISRGGLQPASIDAAIAAERQADSIRRRVPPWFDVGCFVALSGVLEARMKAARLRPSAAAQIRVDGHRGALPARRPPVPQPPAPRTFLKARGACRGGVGSSIVLLEVRCPCLLPHGQSRVSNHARGLRDGSSTQMPTFFPPPIPP